MLDGISDNSLTANIELASKPKKSMISKLFSKLGGKKKEKSP